MKPSEIYDIYFPYPPRQVDEQGRTGKERPALIVTVNGGQAIAISIKITKSAPNQWFPACIPILNWRMAGLEVPSWAEISTINPINRHQHILQTTRGYASSRF
ncbi:hypothetical protein BTO30_04075 [Domibacillus antri]|uniref:Growth inhibitor PemK n=1 Tax=Domibacillus antri TaxID=1714264 RepID=A0A1Q8Q736_9BACI|nr:hypothetical protein [Domibacillus antri]OLN23156.1 hypothetical protein BTO30_04075 [Domibacillus antri]